MSISVTSSDFDAILSDLGVTVSYKAVTNSVNPITGDRSTSFAKSVNKTWIFFKRSNNVLVDKWGVVDNADAYVFMPDSDSLSIGDQVVYDGESFELTNDSKKVNRYVGDNIMYNYYTLFKVS